MSMGALPAARVASAIQPPRFVILSAHPLVVEALVNRVRLVVPDAHILYAGPSKQEALRSAAEGGCDCCVVDLEVGADAAALDVLSTLSMYGVPTVALTARASSAHLESCLAAGVRGYVDKHGDARDVCDAVTAVLDGRTWLASEGPAIRSERATVTLSDQERRALVLYASGMTQDMVARRMGIAPSTVKHYLDRVREKYQSAGQPARTKIELHARARADGLIP